MDRSLPTHAQLSNVALMEEMYAKYLENPESVDPSWRYFFEGMNFASSSAGLGEDLTFKIYRQFGHKKAQFNPLRSKAIPLTKLPFIKKPVESLESIYCSKIGFECSDLYSVEMESWIQGEIENKPIPSLSAEAKIGLLQDLMQAEGFESFLHTKYVGQTRFSLEGGETAIPLLKKILKEGSIQEAFIGMAHRGRLNIEGNLLGKPFPLLFQQFENDLILSEYGQNDVKYHMGYEGNIDHIHVVLPPNPSHLESINPVLLGLVKGTLDKKQLPSQAILPILIHGDASLAGQGVVYETLQLMRLKNYTVGGTIHIVINNQIGYTTSPEEGRSTPYCTDIAKTFQIPIFHVNAEDPESVLFVGQLAAQIREKFGSDVFIDLVCYRKYGHNEGDEPSYTQPLEYQEIKAKKSIAKMYLEKLIQEQVIDLETFTKLETEYKELLQQSLLKAKDLPIPAIARPSFSKMKIPNPSKEELQTMGLQAIQVPDGFALNSKLKKWIDERKKMLEEATPVDWSFAECLAFASLLFQKIPIRLSGEDVQRGTFSQRHIVFIDEQTGQKWMPLQGMQAINSPLTEFAGLGFEYGYSLGFDECLTLWEAQYGDFDNGAQIVIDQYIASGEEKWNQHSSLALLLPHGYEGAGPEHSSARVERFLQLAALNNLRIANPSSPSQYFHLLRRQGLQKEKKPLIILTPKSLLRSPLNVSPFKEFYEGEFQEVIDHTSNRSKITKVICCSGKIVYEVKNKKEDIAVISIEQMYPFPQEAFEKVFHKYATATTLIWLQEEPKNMGIWPFFAEKYPQFTFIGRPAHATPSTGSHKKHKLEQQALIDQALGNNP